MWLDACNHSFAAMIKDKQSREAEEAKATVTSQLCFSTSHHSMPLCYYVFTL